MKKLMITMSAAAMFSLALGANADDPSLLGGMDFENYGEGDPIVAAADPNGDSSIIFWGSAGGESTVAVGGESTVAVEKDAEDTVVNKYLKVDTTDVLVRKTAPLTATDTAAPVAIPEGGDITVSSRVQFTAADEAPVSTTGDKLIVWMRAAAEAEGAEGEQGYKAAVAAAVMVTDKDGAHAIYTVDNAETYQAAWHTLAIKAVASGEGLALTSKFTVTLDGTDYGPFLSMVTGGDAAQTIASIGFKGTGAVDDIAFAANEAVVVDQFTFGVEPTDADGAIDSVAVTVDSEAVEFEGDPILVNCTAESIVVTIAVQEGYEVVSETETVIANEDGTYTITKSVAGTAKDAEVTVAVTVQKKGEGPEPTDDPEIVVPEGKEIADVIDAATSETGIALANVTSKDQVVIDNDEHTIKVGKADAVTIEAFYTAALASDMKSITLTLNAKALDTAGEQVEVTVDDENLGLKVSASNAKLYYGLASSDTVTGEYAAPTMLTPGTGSELTLAAPKKEGAAGFYKLYVTDIAPVK